MMLLFIVFLQDFSTFNIKIDVKEKPLYFVLDVLKGRK